LRFRARFTVVRVLGATTLALVATCLLSPAAWAAGTHRFSASYTGGVSGTTASGKARLAGRGTPIGPSTLIGSGQGAATSPACFEVSGTATLKGRSGSIRISARDAKACVATSNPNEVSFSGSAKVLGGTSAFAHARGTLSFTGSYVRSTSVVKVSFKGRITY